MENTAEKYLESLSEQARLILIGGMAVIAHGFPRTTKDIDIWMEPCKDSETFAEILFSSISFSRGLLFYDLNKQAIVNDASIKTIKYIIENDFVIRIIGLDMPVDIFRIPNNMEINDFEIVWTRAKNISDKIKVLDEIDLLLTKEGTGRPHDIADISFIESKIRKQYCDELKTADYDRALFLFSRYYDYATCEAALKNKCEKVRNLSKKYLTELKESGDPFAAEILETTKNLT